MHNQSNQSDPFDILPDEIVQCVVRRVPAGCMRQVVQVCRRFRDVAQSVPAKSISLRTSVLFRRLYAEQFCTLTHFSNDIRTLLTALQLPRFQHVDEVGIFVDCPSFAKHGKVCTRVHFPKPVLAVRKLHLQSLSRESSLRIAAPAICCMLRTLRNLQSIHFVSLCELGTSVFDAMSSLKLKRLHITRCAVSHTMLSEINNNGRLDGSILPPSVQPHMIDLKLDIVNMQSAFTDFVNRRSNLLLSKLENLQRIVIPFSMFAIGLDPASFCLSMLLHSKLKMITFTCMALMEHVQNCALQFSPPLNIPMQCDEHA